MALLVNKTSTRTGAEVLLPTTAHSADLTVNGGASMPLPSGCDIQIVDARKTALAEAHTTPPTREFIVHAEDALHMPGIQAPESLTGSKFGNPDAVRVRLRGGSLTGVEARGVVAERFPELKTILWEFRVGGIGQPVHRQKLTDTMIYEICLDAGTYYFEIRPAGGDPTYVPIDLSSDMSCTVANEDTASVPQIPNFTLLEYRILWDLAEVATISQTIPVGEGHTYNDQFGSTKDSVCGNLQIDA